MPTRCRGCCVECGHEWNRLRTRIACGAVEWQKPETYRRYSCARCCVDLCVLRQTSRSSWLRWVRESASELTRSPLHFTACEMGVGVDQQDLVVITRSPLLFRACERVSSIVAGERSRYLPVPIDIGTIPCPDCGDPLNDGELVANAAVCPLCMSRCASWTAKQHPDAVFAEYSPVPEADVRWVISHLRALAAYPKDQQLKLTPGIPTSEIQRLLWDRDLDGLFPVNESRL